MYVLNRWPKDTEAPMSKTSYTTQEKADLGGPSSHSWPSQQEAGSSKMMDVDSSQPTHKSSPSDKSYSAFFKRSISLFDSTPPELSLDDSATAPESAFSRSVTEELPLAEQPHLLSLQAKKSSLVHTAVAGRTSSSASSHRASMPVSLHAGRCVCACTSHSGVLFHCSHCSLNAIVCLFAAYICHIGSPQHVKA